MPQTDCVQKKMCVLWNDFYLQVFPKKFQIHKGGGYVMVQRLIIIVFFYPLFLGFTIKMTISNMMTSIKRSINLRFLVLFW